MRTPFLGLAVVSVALSSIAGPGFAAGSTQAPLSVAVGASPAVTPRVVGCLGVILNTLPTDGAMLPEAVQGLLAGHPRLVDRDQKAASALFLQSLAGSLSVETARRLPPGLRETVQRVRNAAKESPELARVLARVSEAIASEKGTGKPVGTPNFERRADVSKSMQGLSALAVADGRAAAAGFDGFKSNGFDVLAGGLEALPTFKAGESKQPASAATPRTTPPAPSIYRKGAAGDYRISSPMQRIKSFIASLAFVGQLLMPGHAVAAVPAGDAEQARLESRQAIFAPVDLEADVSSLSANERQALAKLVQAAQVMDGLFLRQSWAGNEAMLLKLAADTTPLGRARLKTFVFQKGPWDRQDSNRPFLAGAPAKPDEANFYPAGSTKAEIETWINGLPEAEKARAAGFFSVIRRGADGKLASVPYSLEYQNELAAAAKLLREAAALTSQATLKDYLEKRAAAFLSDDYYASDVAWMRLDSSIEPTVGPYEVYEDGWFNFKAAFEAFITLRDDAETAKLARFASELQWLEDNLPIAPSLRNPKLGALAPIRVVNQVFAAGDAAHGVATAAYNLPNDEKVTSEMGSKRTMLKNVQRAKFDVVLVPLSRLALSPADQDKVSFEAFFTHILMHELMHGLGPHHVTLPDGKTISVRERLQELGSPLEEAKADISGLWALQRLVDKGVLSKDLERTMYVTFLASGFRTLRFGATEAHGKGMALQINYLLEKGGFTIAKDGTFGVDAAKIRGAVEALTREIMRIQARGDYAAAKALLEKYGALGPEIKAVLEKANSLPVDIAPRHKTAEALLGR